MDDEVNFNLSKPNRTFAPLRAFIFHAEAQRRGLEAVMRNFCYHRL